MITVTRLLRRRLPAAAQLGRGRARVQEDFDHFLRRLHPGSECLLLQHLTRHDLNCLGDGCPACAHANRHHPSPWVMQELRQRQLLLQFLSLERRQRLLTRDRRFLERAMAEDGAAWGQEEEEDDEDSDE